MTMQRLIVLAIVVLLVLFVGSLIIGNVNNGLLNIELNRDNIEELNKSLFGEADSLDLNQIATVPDSPELCLDGGELEIILNTRCTYRISQPDYEKKVLELSLKDDHEVKVVLSARSRLTVTKLLPDDEGNETVSFDIFQGESMLIVECGSLDDEPDNKETCVLEIE
jgi:hypothetical protein